MRHDRTGPDWYWRVTWLLGSLTALFFIWVSFRLGGSKVTEAVDDEGELLAALVSAAACWGASRQKGAAGTAWRLLAASSFSWALGEAMWCYLELIRGVAVPFPSLADLGFLSAVPLAIAGLVSFVPGRIRRSSAHGATKLTGAVVAFMATSLLLIAIGHSNHASGVTGQVIGLAYPVSDLLMAAVVLAILRRGSREAASLRLVLAGVLCFTMADSSFAYLTAIGSYGTGNALDTGWVIGYFLIALGALRNLRTPTVVADNPAQLRYSMPAGSYRSLTPTSSSGIALSWPAPSRGMYFQPSWFTQSAANHIVYSGVILLIMADAGVSLYDLSLILRMLI